jgi:L-lactate dehydrogenase complex protein LldE
MKVALQITCINDVLYPETGRATVRLLRRLGVNADFPTGQTCCGQPMVNAGSLDEAIPAVRRYVEAFAGYDAVVTPSGSCAASVRHQHRLVARRSGDDVLIDAVAKSSPKVYELTGFLVDVLRVTDVGAYFPHRVTYHPTCHSLRLLEVGDRPRRLLGAVRAWDHTGRSPSCRGVLRLRRHVCDQERGYVGGDGRRQGAACSRDRAEVLVAGDNSCLMHIGGLLSRQRAGVRVVHLAEVLATSDAGAR